MANYLQKLFTIHFPGKKVYIENTLKSPYDKMEDIKNDKDHKLYSLLQEYPNPKILFSFGLSEKKNQETGKLAGYSIPVCLWSRDSAPNPKELSFFETINKCCFNVPKTFRK